jgi:hypothetical protein
LQAISPSLELALLSTGLLQLILQTPLRTDSHDSAVASAAVLSPASSLPPPSDNFSVDYAADDFVTSDARRFIRSAAETGGPQDGIDAGGSGNFSHVREAHARAFALAHASAIVLLGLQKEKEGGQHQHRARSTILSREGACVDACLTEEWRRHIRSAQLEAGAAEGGAAAGWCEAARAMRWFALPFDGLKLNRAGGECDIENEWQNCVWSKVLHSREHDGSAFALSEAEWQKSIWAVAWMQQQPCDDQPMQATLRQQLLLRRDVVTQEQSAVVIHLCVPSSPHSVLPSNSASPYIQFLTQSLQRLVPLHPRATFFELCRIAGALWISGASSSRLAAASSPSSSAIPVDPPSPIVAVAVNAPFAGGISAVDVHQPQNWLIKPAAAVRPKLSSSAAPIDSDDASAKPSPLPFSRHPNPYLSQKATQLLGTKIRKLMTKASMEFDMIREGDRILVGLSGGKDSLTMLVLLLDLQRRAPFKFSVAACTVEPGAAEFDPSPLKAYVTPQLGIPYFFESDTIIQRAKGVGGKFSICAYCARQKRGILYSTALREGYNVLALAQHADDLAESFLMSAMHNGRLRTMKACAVSRALFCACDSVAGELHQRQGCARYSAAHVRVAALHFVVVISTCSGSCLLPHAQLRSRDDDEVVR